jgi:hypothetical protein
LKSRDESIWKSNDSTSNEESPQSQPSVTRLFNSKVPASVQNRSTEREESCDQQVETISEFRVQTELTLEYQCTVR